MGGGWSVLEADYGEGVFLFGFSLLSKLLSALGAGGVGSGVEGWVVVVMDVLVGVR